MWRLPLANAAHPEFLILIKRDGPGFVHRSGSSRLRRREGDSSVRAHRAQWAATPRAVPADAEALFANAL